MAITDDLLDQLNKDYKKPEDLIGENGLLKQMTCLVNSGHYFFEFVCIIL